MTDEPKEQQESEASPEGSQPDAPTSSETDKTVGDMEQGIERVDEHIEDAKEEAEKAEGLDPQPLADSGGEQQSSNG